MSTTEIVYLIPSVLSLAQYRRLVACLNQMAHRWQYLPENAWLRDDFGSEQVRQVLNFMAQIEYPLFTEADYFGMAKRQLRKFWRRNRNRDIGRVLRKAPVFLEDIHAETWMEDLRFGDPEELVQHQFLVETLPQALQDLGLPEPVAWAWIWREGQRDSWSDVAEMLAAQLGVVENVANLRQWKNAVFR